MLDGLPGTVSRPGYDPARLTPGIVHLGLGNFHRAHMARYTHALMARDVKAARWGILGVGMLPGDRTLRDALASQDWLYTLVERDGEGERAEIVGVLCGMVLIGDDAAKLLGTIDDPGIRIVSLTVTERGYCLSPESKRLDLAHPAIAADLAAPEHPQTAIGLIVEALRRRRAAGASAFTAMSCDNIQHNGDVLKRAVLDFAHQRDPGLADWIDSHARFPNTMVDRITPATRAQDVTALAARYGIHDAAPVFCEPFCQWVIEDDFADGRPAWERVGVQCVPDVTPYEKMKLRLLNASHLALAGIGTLMGYSLVDEAMGDPALRAYLGALMDRETGPTLDPVPGIDLAAYKADVMARFSNPTIGDTLARINNDAPLNYLLDPLRDRLDRGEPAPLLACAIAAWIRRTSGEGPHVVIDEKLFGTLAGNAAFVSPVMDWLARFPPTAEARSNDGWRRLLASV